MTQVTTTEAVIGLLSIAALAASERRARKARIEEQALKIRLAMSETIAPRCVPVFVWQIRLVGLRDKLQAAGRRARRWNVSAIVFKVVCALDALLLAASAYAAL